MRLKALVWLLSGVILIAVTDGCVSSLWAQTGTTGALAGTVTDPSGNPLPGATVTLRNTSNGQTQTSTTGADGRYGFPTLPPDTYELRFSAEGFETTQVDSVAVNVSEDTVVDAKEQAGEATQVVACQCTVVHGSSSSSGTLMESKTITAVPLTTRNFTQVLSTAAGAASDVNNAGRLGGGNQMVNVNGNTSFSNYTIDGARAQGVPNPDTISQFRIQTSQYDSGYGSHVPTTNLVTKAGSNDLHGTVWEFIRNDIFNANEFFQNSLGQPKPNLKQNQFGGALGGPIKKNRLFFFGSYQGTRQINGLDPTSLSTLILPPLTDDRSAATIASQFCPANFGSRANTFAQGKQLDCNNLNTSTTASVNPVALKMLQATNPDGSYVIPTPQRAITSGTNTGLGISSYSVPSTWDENHYLGNVDYVISQKHNLAGRFFMSKVNQYRSFGSPMNAMPGTAPFVPGAGAPQIFTSKNYITTAKITSVLTNNLVNEIRFSYSRDAMVAGGIGSLTATSMGMTPIDPFFDEPPEITVQGSMGVFRFFGNVGNDSASNTDTYQWSDNISWVHGRHTIRTGVYVDSALFERFDTGQARGKLTFQNFTDFLIGLDAASNGSPRGFSNIDSVAASEGAGPQGEVQYDFRTRHVASFLQDDFKLSPRFTLNLGLRWEYLPATYDTAGNMGNIWYSLLAQMPIPPASGTYIGDTVAANYDPSVMNPYTGQPFGPPPVGVITRSSKSLYRNDTPLDTLAPRFGFAWQPLGNSGRMVMRGGYGWFYQTPQTGGNAMFTTFFTAPPSARGFTNTGSSNSGSKLADPFGATAPGFQLLGFQQRTPTSRLSDRIGGELYHVPLVQQWNLNMQWNLMSSLSLDMGYVGSFGTHLLIVQGLNQPVLASASKPVNCGYDPANPSNCITTNTSANTALRVPILGETPTALGANDYIGLSRYNGLQVTLRKQTSHGLTFQLSYTYSKSMNDNNRMNDQTNRFANWSRATFDRTHRTVFNYTYEIPAPNANGFVGAMLKGWSMSGVTSIQSGSPMTLSDRSGGTVYGRAGNATITFCPGATNASLATSGRNQSRLNHWFDTTGICNAPGVGSDTPAATGYGNAGQGIVTGPGQFDWDMSLGKSTRVGGIREDSELQFRVEFYNAFNHPQFSNPGTILGTANFGVVTQTSVSPRLIQMGIKYLF